MFGTPAGAGGMPTPKAGGIFGTQAPAPAAGLPAAVPFGTNKIGAATAPGGLFATTPAAVAAAGTPAKAPAFGTPGMRRNAA